MKFNNLWLVGYCLVVEIVVVFQNLSCFVFIYCNIGTQRRSQSVLFFSRFNCMMQDLPTIFIAKIYLWVRLVKVEKILKDSLDSIPSPSVKIHIMGRKGVMAKHCWNVVNKLLNTKSLLTIIPSNVLSLCLKRTFPPIIWIFTEGESDMIESRLLFKIFFTLLVRYVANNSKFLNCHSYVRGLFLSSWFTYQPFFFQYRYVPSFVRSVTQIWILY